jgi:predicted enzyme related to lactoylglutathione lyase
MSIQIKDIAFTGTPVTDLKRARAFYEGVLGLAVSRTFGDENSGWVEYDIGPGNNTFAIGSGIPQWQPSPLGTSIGFEVADLDAAIAHLKANNVAIHGEPFESPVCRMAVAADPDGNSICLHQCKAK